MNPETFGSGVDEPKATAAQVAIQPLDHRNPAVAQQIHDVMKLAYAQEARLLGVKDLPPLQRTVQDIQAGDVFYLGAVAVAVAVAVEDGQLLGALSIGADDEADQLLIGALVVHPAAQRRGIGRALVLDALRRSPGMTMAVSTGFDNGPALALYRAMGFVAYRRGVMGPEALAVVKLRRSGADLSR